MSKTVLILHKSVWVLFVCTLLSAAFSAPAASAEVMKLKSLYLDTVLVEQAKSQAVIVAPQGERYRSDVALLQQRIQKITGVSIPVHPDDAAPEELLKKYHVIAVGNMATNRFIEKLYRQWRVILDLKYPGEGGYVVRSLHNPFGTSRNVLFLGGSDDAGVAEAARVFASALQQGKNLKVGWLQKIKLGKGITPPVISAYLKEWKVQSWNDSRRKLSNGKEVGYPPATYFGWNPISIAGALYYMTGQDEYLQTFKELAIPDPRNLPLPNRTSDSFTDPANPLVKSYHYHAYLVDCIFDLIEESPLFSDKERLFITNKLLEHQKELEPSNSFYFPNGDRHTLWHMLCIYTGSRYFSLYYPDPSWDLRRESVRKSFNSIINNPSWGERDTLTWVATSIQPLFEFFLLDGDGEFVSSGTARTLMKALEVLRSGREQDDYSFIDTLSISQLHQAAYLLKDTGYIWMARQLGYDLDAFRIGLSFWPQPDQKPIPPVDLINAITTIPLAKYDRELSKTPVAQREAFQLLSYRSGLEGSDDYFLLDGFEGLGRHPYQLNTLLRLRMFRGKEILSGDANDLAIWFNGMSGSQIARGAALKQVLAQDGFAFVHTEVPDMPASTWARRILYLKGIGAVVVDRVLPTHTGQFDIAIYWQMVGGIREQKPSNRILSSNGVGVVSADTLLERLPSGKTLRGRISRNLRKDEPLTLAALFFNELSPKAIVPLKRGGYMITGSKSAYVGDGPLHSAELSCTADFAYLENERIFLEGARELIINGTTILKSDRPITLLWDLKESVVAFSAVQETRVVLNTNDSKTERVVPAGDTTVASVAAHPEIARLINVLLPKLADGVKAGERYWNSTENGKATWKPLWEKVLPGKISALVLAEQSGGGGIWAVSQGGKSASLLRLNANGSIMNTTELTGEVLSIWPAKSRTQASSFALLAGLKDDFLTALDVNGREIWRVKTELHLRFMIGDRYDAPWFTDPRPPNNMSGVFSILAGDLWGAGLEEIAVGRPCTVEFRGLDGSLRGRVPTQWGTNSSLALLLMAQGPTVLAGKNYTGNPTLSGINRQYKNIGDGMFGSLSPNFPNMHAWLQRGLGMVRISDINGDDKDEIIYTLSGHWNELRVYDSNQKPLWMKSFGPDKLTGGAPFMSSLVVADLEGIGRKVVVVGTRNGWINAFDARGDSLWQQQFSSAITALSANDKLRQIAVGCEDGSLFLVNNTGKTMVHGKMKGAVQQLVFNNEGLFAGTAAGIVRSYPVVAY